MIKAAGPGSPFSITPCGFVPAEGDSGFFVDDAGRADDASLMLVKDRLLTSSSVTDRYSEGEGYGMTGACAKPGLR